LIVGAFKIHNSRGSVLFRCVFSVSLQGGLADLVRGSSTSEDARRNPPPVRVAWRARRFQALDQEQVAIARLSFPAIHGE
jgi:hypothetical protein